MPGPQMFARYPLVAWLERRTRRQVTVVAVLVGLYLLFRGASSLGGVILDRWWYDSVTDAPVWSTITKARVELVVAAGVVSFVVLAGSLALVARGGRLPDASVGGIVRRYRGRMGPAHTWILAGAVVFLVVRIAAAANANWQAWLLFLHGDNLGRSVPELGGDLGYYLFKLPFLAVVSGWFRQLILVTLALTVFAYLISGGLRLPGRGRHSQPRALAHVGLLVALFAGAQALDYVFVRRPSQAVSTAGSFVGAGYTEVHVIVPATWVAALFAVAAGFALVIAARTGKWKVALVLVGLWALAHVVGLLVLPAIVNRVVVAPAVADRQLPYLDHNLKSTREAYGLDTIVESKRTVADGVTEAPADDGALDRFVLFDPDRLPAALQVLQGRAGSRITDVDLDRYVIDGELRPVMIAPRAASLGDLPESGWAQSHLVYTHGDGVVAVPADEADADGRPDVDSLADVIVPERPQLYFGDGLTGWYAIVDTKREEQGGVPFGADTGIAMSSLFQRSVLSLATGDVEPLLSSELTSDSQLLYRRGINERLNALAPFLSFGTDPYAVVTDEGVQWVVDGYTTSSTYPYSQFAGFVGDTVNYARASVKATIDAYDGTVHLYRTEAGESDPILAAWEHIFPNLIEPIADMPADLQAHLRYPTELLGVQNALLGRYHVEDAETLFNGTQRWSPSAAAGATVGAGSPGPSQPTLMFMPDADQALGGDWVAVMPFSPGAGAGSNSARDKLAALGAADNDDPQRTALLAVDTPPGRDVSTPLVAQSAIDADPDIAQRITLLNANGSSVEFGPMTPMLFQDELVWLRSILVTGTSSTTTPRLYGVVAVSNGIVGFGPDAASALADAVSPSSS